MFGLGDCRNDQHAMVVTTMYCTVWFCYNNLEMARYNAVPL